MTKLAVNTSATLRGPSRFIVRSPGSRTAPVTTTTSTVVSTALVTSRSGDSTASPSSAGTSTPL